MSAEQSSTASTFNPTYNRPEIKEGPKATKDTAYALDQLARVNPKLAHTMVDLLVKEQPNQLPDFVKDGSYVPNITNDQDRASQVVDPDYAAFDSSAIMVRDEGVLLNNREHLNGMAADNPAYDFEKTSEALALNPDQQSKIAQNARGIAILDTGRGTVSHADLMKGIEVDPEAPEVQAEDTQKMRFSIREARTSIRQMNNQIAIKQTHAKLGTGRDNDFMVPSASPAGRSYLKGLATLVKTFPDISGKIRFHAGTALASSEPKLFEQVKEVSQKSNALMNPKSTINARSLGDIGVKPASMQHAKAFSSLNPSILNVVSNLARTLQQGLVAAASR